MMDKDKRQERELDPKRGDLRPGSDQEQSGSADPHRHEGGWNRDEDGVPERGRLPATDRDRDYDPDGDRIDLGG